jgi:phosphomevalonate kinase
LVLSGAYAVLEGAPAVVAAVDRYAEADDARTAAMITDEVARAIEQHSLVRAPWFDASALRHTAEGVDRKLGLGSSAAILAASLAVQMLSAGVADEELAQRVFDAALSAHRAAQPGGSGVDVAASSLGGVLRCDLIVAQPGRHGPPLNARAHTLPAGLVIEVWVCSTSASTQAMLAKVRALRDVEPARYRALLDEAAQGAEALVGAPDAEAAVVALRRQFAALGELGRHSGADVVTDQVGMLDAAAAGDGACVGPSGAGGGDVALFYGLAPSSPRFRARANGAGLSLVPMQIGARGVHRVR